MEDERGVGCTLSSAPRIECAGHESLLTNLMHTTIIEKQVFHLAPYLRFNCSVNIWSTRMSHLFLNHCLSDQPLREALTLRFSEFCHRKNARIAFSWFWAWPLTQYCPQSAILLPVTDFPVRRWFIHLCVRDRKSTFQVVGREINKSLWWAIIMFVLMTTT